MKFPGMYSMYVYTATLLPSFILRCMESVDLTSFSWSSWRATSVWERGGAAFWLSWWRWYPANDNSSCRDTYIRTVCTCVHYCRSYVLYLVQYVSVTCSDSFICRLSTNTIVQGLPLGVHAQTWGCVSVCFTTILALQATRCPTGDTKGCLLEDYGE